MQTNPDRRLRHGKTPNRPIATVLLWLLTFLFLLRVLGQFLVAFFGVTFLPQMEKWQSGLLPYPLLLLSQVLILGLQTRINLDITRRRGFFSHPRPRTGRVIRWVSILYLAAMLLRYIITMAIYPEWRWFHGTIPIFFHWVLAAYLFVLSACLHRGRREPEQPQ